MRWWRGYEQPPRQGYAQCGGCKRIREAHTWCDACEAPEVLRENVTRVLLFLQALPEWRAGGFDHAFSGFSRPGVEAVLRLNAVAQSEHAEAWGWLGMMEGEFRQILAHEAEQAKQQAEAERVRDKLRRGNR